MGESEKKLPKRVIECSYTKCKWTFDSNYKLQRHLKSHTKEKPFKCQECDKTFSYEYNMKFHLKSHSSGNAEIASNDVSLNNVENNVEFPAQCPYKRCVKRFRNKEELQLHVTNHNMQYKCTLSGCSKVFRRPSLLKQHLLIHNGIYPFQCNVLNCTKTFVKAQNLKQHKLLHANKKEFVCDSKNCGKAFNTIEYLKIHQRTHEKTKKYKCPIGSCQKWFVCTQTLKIHLKGHENIRAYVCDYQNCNKSYLTLSNLKCHKKLHLSNKGTKKSEVTPNIQNNDDVQNEIINVNDFINISLFEEKSTKIQIPPDNQSLSKEDLLAAAFGEIACNEYIHGDKIEPINKAIGCINPDTDVVNTDFDDSTILPQNEENLFQATFIEDIQFQEEFPSNIYMHSVNNYRTCITGHDYEQSEYDIPSNISLTSQNINQVDEFSGSSGLVAHDIDYISETSMELSTGHLEINGDYFCSSLCLPDHVYSHQMSDSNSLSINDIR